jgi:glycosyltransferase involved in cell wall biosynthesis
MRKDREIPRPVPYKYAEIDLLKPLDPLTLGPDETGLAVLARFGDRIAGFNLKPLPTGTSFTSTTLAELLRDWFGIDLIASHLEGQLSIAPANDLPLPNLTIAICTHNRAERLIRLLDSLMVLSDVPDAPPHEILVIDNASPGDETRKTTESFEGVRYIWEPKAGLNFARNAALAHAQGDYIAFLDDDVTVDRAWLQGFYKAWHDAPQAGGFTGFVLPFALQTEAQILFERNGGFRRGARPLHHGQSKRARPIYPCGAGIIGAGCNMAFAKDVLEQLGGFDVALDTGAPLPGGGDLDIFYRVIRSGHSMAYEPQFAVYHEHRETLDQLKAQYRSWGLGFMAFLMKSWRSDPLMHKRQMATIAWWFTDRFRHLTAASLGRTAQKPSHIWAELIGGIKGIFGEYDRSKARVKAIEEAHS